MQCNADEKLDFIEIADFLELLKKYEQNHNKGLNFYSYYKNEIIDFLNSKKKMKYKS